VTLSYAAGYAVAGDAPWIQHLINALAHVAAAVLAFLLLLRIAGNIETAALAALIFAVHPAHTESVVWVPGRTDVIATAFMLGAWLLLLRAREKASERRRFSIYAAASVAYLAALGSKEIAVALPALVFFHDLLARGKEIKEHKWEYAVMAVLTGAFIGWRSYLLSGPGPDPAPNALAGLPAWRAALSMIMIFAFALRVTLLPLSWRIDFAWADSILSAPLWVAGICAATVLILAVGALLLWKKRPLVSFAVIGFFISVLPVSHLVPFPTLFAERFMYLPGLFVCLLVATLAAPLLDKKTSLAIALILVLAIGSLSVMRGRAFKDDLVFWQTAVKQVPRSALARNWLGIAFRNRKIWDNAEKQYKKALELDPGYTVAKMNLAEVCIINNDFDRAFSLLEQALDEDPANPLIRINLGNFFAIINEWDNAQKLWRSALDIDPDNFAAHLNLVRYYLKFNDRDKAGVHYDELKRIDPNHPAVENLKKEFTPL
jgi:hypothetical protein